MRLSIYAVAFLLAGSTLAFASIAATSAPYPCGNARAGYGGLSAEASSGGLCGIFPNISTASFADQVEIIGPVSQGFVSLTASFTGFSFDGGDKFGTVSLGAAGVSFWPIFNNQPLISTVEIPFVTGVPFHLAGTLQAGANGLYSPYSTAYAQGHLSINSITVMDQNHTPLTDYQYKSDASASYPFVGGTTAIPVQASFIDTQFIPEPRTAALLAAGLLGLLRRRRGR